MKLTDVQIQAEIDRLTPIVAKQQAEAGMDCDPWGSADGQELLRLQRIQSARVLNKIHPGNRFRLMFGQPLLPEEKEQAGLTGEQVAAWIDRNNWQGSTAEAKTAIEDAQTIHNAFVPIPEITACEHKCEHEWENSPTADTPTRTKCRLCQQTAPF